MCCAGPPCIRTIAEPFGCFEAYCNLHPRATLPQSDGSEWATRVSASVGSLCDRKLDDRHARYWRKTEKRHQEQAVSNCLADFSAECVADHLSESIRTLLSHPLHFAIDIAVLSTAPRRAHLKVSVALRPIAFIATAQKSTVSVDELGPILRAIFPLAPSIIDQRR